MTASRNITVAAQPLPPLAELEPLWQNLQARADATFFTSWAWVRAWLETVATQKARLSLIVARNGDAVTGLCIVVLGPRGLRTLGQQKYYLQQTGLSALDVMYVEYNDILAARDFALDTRVAILNAVCGAHALIVSAGQPAVEHAMSEAGLKHRVFRSEICDFVDLTKITDSQVTRPEPVNVEQYLETLSANSRHQIRRAIRLSEAGRPIEIARAQDVATARAYIAEMAVLHAAGWNERKGLPGAFASAVFRAFVDRLIEHGIESGAVDVLRIGSTDRVIGFLLNFVHAKEVYAYQSGFAYSPDNKEKPGLVCHALAISHYRAAGQRGYHFMAGKARYKTTLSNSHEHMIWVESRPSHLLARFEDLCQTAWHKFRDLGRPSQVSIPDKAE